jgi:iron complex outermembrane receptor protein
MRGHAFVGGVVLAALVAPAAIAQTPASIGFRIAEQPVKTALATFSRQSGLRILFPYAEVEGLRSHAVNGTMPARAALARLIAGTPLRVAMARDGVIALAVDAPVGANNGHFTHAIELASMTLPAGLLQASPTPIAESPRPSETVQDDSNPSSEIIVTGSRGQERTVTTSPTPIDVIGGAELERTGRPGIFSSLNTLVPSFNLPTRAGGGTSTVISTGGLRGLNPDQTLVLVNGKRRHKTSLINAVSSLYNGSVPVDLDMIPASSIDHIEVLRDGAAAQYGSDAIAGVINIILKKNVSGGDASFTAGQNMDRSDGENYLAQASYGLKIGENGYADFSADAKKQDASNRAVPIASSVQLYNRINGLPDPREATADRLVTKNYGAFPQKSFNLGYNAGYDFGGIEFYSFGTFSQRNSELNFTFRAPNNAASLPQIYPNGFYPELDIHEQDYEFALGLKGDVAGWNWDLSSSYGKNRSRQTASHTLNPSLGPTSPTDFYVGTLQSTEWVNSLDVTRGYDVGGNLQVSAGLQHRLETYGVYQGDPSSYAAGTYTYVNSQGVLQRPAPGAQAAAGFQPADQGHKVRNSIAGYVDLAYDPTDRLTLGLAGRFEHYDDSSGNTATGKATARYAVTKWLAVRGAVSNGFRAPALAQQIYASTTGQFRIVNGALDLLQIKTLPVGSPSAIALGATPLKPETSLNYSAGIVLTPTRLFNVTVDAYQIKVDDRIALTSTLTGTAVSNILVANGLSGDISAQYYSNAINTRTRGVDVVATYKLGLDRFGSMRLNLGFNYNKTIITHVRDNPPQLSALGSGYVLFDRLSRGYLTTALPKTKLFLGDVWTVSKFTVSARLVRYGDFTVLQNDPTSDRHFGARWLTDAEVAWQATKGLNLAVGANNLFNVYPAANGIYNASLGSGQYPTTQPYSFTGGYYYARVGVSF